MAVESSTGCLGDPGVSGGAAIDGDGAGRGAVAQVAQRMAEEGSGGLSNWRLPAMKSR